MDNSCSELNNQISRMDEKQIINYVPKLLEILGNNQRLVKKLQNNLNDANNKIEELQNQLGNNPSNPSNPSNPVNPYIPPVINLPGIDKANLNKKCLKYISNDFITDRSYYKNKLGDINYLIATIALPTPANLANITQLSLAKKLISQKYLLMGEYYFNEMVATNVSNYTCDKILND
ncbi:MAG: hypothetical protein Edafosvirus9_33 [Edafosvirus sp.]|uniref:Uncharacterized protein n=1 Tax=Edafosvirus sp. TaxID=2487765 RepID=A0A3G4ZY48_9VIRU|nr:MAG: hypothetical protein Edafosvirus9_33 [Edafosvirus sp.]